MTRLASKALIGYKQNFMGNLEGTQFETKVEDLFNTVSVLHEAIWRKMLYLQARCSLY